MKKIIAVFALLFFISSCDKTKDVFVKDNIPPPDHTIDSALVDIYANKVYVNLLGREPVGNERTQALAILKQNNFSKADREQFLDDLFAKTEYRTNLYTVANHEYLNDLDSLDVVFQIYLFNTLITQPQYAPFVDVIQGEIDRLELLEDVKADLIAGTLSYKDMLKRVSFNYFYDQINMGTENFVVSTFQNYFFRYPSDAELASAKTMVDGLNSTVLLETGKNKTDYVNIFFDSDDYYEGRVRFVFVKYLFREPSSAEIGYYADLYKSTGNFNRLQRELFASDEYAGVQ